MIEQLGLGSQQAKISHWALEEQKKVGTFGSDETFMKETSSNYNHPEDSPNQKISEK